MSRHPIQIGVVTTPTPEKGSWANINGEAYPTPPYPPIPLHCVSDENGTLLPVTGVPVAGLGLPVVCPSNSTPLKSTVHLLPASGITNGDFSPNNAHSFTHVDTASNLPVVLILSSTLHTHPVKSQEKRESQDRSHQYQKSRKKARTPQFSCDDCGAKYVQQQGLNRHRREKHKPSLCMYCDAEWGRPYEYRVHLEKYHPDVDPDIVLGKVAGSRRRSACFARHRSQRVSLPIIKHGRRAHSGIGRYPHAVAKPSRVTLSPPDMTYVAQPESTQPIMTNKSTPEGEHMRTTWIGLHGTPQDGYAGHSSNPVMTPSTAFTPTVDGYHGSPNFYLHT